MRSSLVGSEMCIRDRAYFVHTIFILPIAILLCPLNFHFAQCRLTLPSSLSFCDPHQVHFTKDPPVRKSSLDFTHSKLILLSPSLFCDPHQVHFTKDHPVRKLNLLIIPILDFILFSPSSFCPHQVYFTKDLPVWKLSFDFTHFKSLLLSPISF